VKFKVDENLPEEVIAELRAHQYDAMGVANQGLAGKDDSVIAMCVQGEARCLITLDLDFSDLRAYLPSDYHGIIVIRSKKQDKATVLALVKKFVPLLATESVARRLWIVEEDRIRIRGEME
jgi:predicted nuclease of predicted toxin-antitoxin system